MSLEQGQPSEELVKRVKKEQLELEEQQKESSTDKIKDIVDKAEVIYESLPSFCCGY